VDGRRPRYGRSPRGARLRDHTPCSHWETQTVIATLRLDDLQAPAAFDGPVDTARFLALRRTDPRADRSGRAPSRCWFPQMTLACATPRLMRDRRPRSRSKTITGPGSASRRPSRDVDP